MRPGGWAKAAINQTSLEVEPEASTALVQFANLTAMLVKINFIYSFPQFQLGLFQEHFSLRR